MVDFDAGHLVIGDFILVEETRVAVLAFDPYSILHIFLDRVVVDLTITANVLATE